MLIHFVRHLYKCFNDNVPVRRRLKRYKHWFQDEDISINPIVNGTLVIAMFRNVYDWSGAMMATVSFKRPYIIFPIL